MKTASLSLACQSFSRTLMTVLSSQPDTEGHHWTRSELSLGMWLVSKECSHLASELRSMLVSFPLQ
jgi:hypothetical protein